MILLVIHLILSLICFCIYMFWWFDTPTLQTDPLVVILTTGIISLIPIVNATLIIQAMYDLSRGRFK